MDSSHNPIRTIADIAKLANVSKSTVSRALNDSPLISDKTKTRIRAIAEANNFEIHQGARNLSLQRSQTIALVVSIDPELGRFVTDPFSIELLGAIANTLAINNYDLLLAQIRQDEPKSFYRYFSAKQIDGMILFSCDLPMAEFIKLTKQSVPFILWGTPHQANLCCAVGSDDITGGYLATKHLLELGRRRIAFIGGSEKHVYVLERYKGYKKALIEAGLEINPALLIPGNYTSAGGYKAMQTLLDQEIALDAVFADSDLMAIGAMEALRANNRRVPHDIAMVGYDGIQLSAHCSPPLTTVRQNITQGGELLAKNLLQYIDDKIITNVVLPVELIVRQSTIGETG